MEENVNPNQSTYIQGQPVSLQMEEEEDGIDFLNIFVVCVHNWYWFAICIVIALVLAFFKVKSQENVYSRTATIMIKEEATGGSSKLDVEADMGIFKSTSTVQNEIIAMKSPQVVNDVVKRLKLYMNYAKDGRFHRETLYGWNLPVEVNLENIGNEDWASLTLELHEDGTYLMKDFSDGSGKELIGKINQRIKTPLGVAQVVPTANFKPQNMTIYVSHGAVTSTASGCIARLTVKQRSEKSSVIDLSFTDVSIQRAEEFLNMLITVYSEYWVNDRNQISISTNKFISERIAVIEKELGHVDSDISSYKSQNLIPNLSNSIGQNMSEAAEANKATIDLNNQLSMANFLKQYLLEKKDLKELIPAITGIEGSNIDGLISNYNDLVLERNSLATNSSDVNPLVKEHDEQLTVLRGVIMSTIDNVISSLDTKLKSSKSVEVTATTKMANNPEQEKYLLSVERQQEVKQALYTYLLQKREENELSQAFTAYNTRLVNPPTGDFIPIAPNAQQIYMLYLAVGAAIPLLIIALFEILNNTVRGRKDLESMRAPYLGEIPMARTINQLSFWKSLKSVKDLKEWAKEAPFITHLLMEIGFYKKDDKQSDKNLRLYVKSGSRNQINEAFRVVRSNMEFMQGESKNQVLMITSANAGSGKTFVTLNLAASFSVKERKVLAIDMDFRKRSLSKYVQKPKRGLADYLAKLVDDYHNLIIKGSLMEGLDVLPVGSIPPNPTELLYSDRFKNMLDELRTQYDLIFLDCPPIEIVADASIIAKYADKSIFLVRAGLLQRAMLKEIDHFYDNHKFGNLYILLNGTDDSYGKYGYSKYGYRYGYHYGYGGNYSSES